MNNWQHAVQVLFILSAMAFGINGLISTAVDVYKHEVVNVPGFQKTKNLAISLAAEQDSKYKPKALHRSGVAF